MKRKLFLIVAVVLAIGMLFSFSLTGCKTTTTEETTAVAETTAAETTAAEGKKLIIGFAASTQTMEWMTFAIKDAQAVAEEEGVELVIYDSENKVEKQGSIIEDLISQKVDAIIVNPINVEALNPFLVEADDAGVPVGTFDRRAEGAPYFAFIGCDDVKGGQLGGEFIVEKLGGKGNVIVLQGELGTSPEIDRGNGLDSAIKDYPDIKIVFKQTGNWMKEEGLKVMEDAITTTDGQFDAVYTYNDSMMLGALQAMKDAGLDQSKIVTVAYDGVPDALIAIRDGELDATTQNPVGVGGAIVKIMVDYLRDGIVPEEKDMKMDPWIITKDNLETGDFYSLIE